MKTLLQRITVFLSLAAVLFALSGCGSTRSENGVTIEQKRNWLPKDWLPF